MTTTPKRPKLPNGRPPYQPTDAVRAQVKQMAAFGLTADEIGCVLQLSRPTVHKYFHVELTMGGPHATVRVAQSLYQQAIDPTHPKSAIACMFWLKCRAGWREQDIDGSKKAQVQEHARTAHEGTAWDDVLPSLVQ